MCKLRKTIIHSPHNWISQHNVFKRSLSHLKLTPSLSSTRSTTTLSVHLSLFVSLSSSQSLSLSLNIIRIKLLNIHILVYLIRSKARNPSTHTRACTYTDVYKRQCLYNIQKLLVSIGILILVTVLLSLSITSILNSKFFKISYAPQYLPLNIDVYKRQMHGSAREQLKEKQTKPYTHPRALTV